MKRFKLVLILLVFSAFIAGCDIGHTHNYIDGVCECGNTIVDKFKVTFIDYDGSILKQEMVEPNASAVAPENPVRAGYEFVGWNTSFDNVNGDLIIVAQYNYIGESHKHEYIDGKCECGAVLKDKYLVTFLDYDGTILKSEEVKSTSPAIAPTNPTREGYEFIGWDVSYDCITSDLVVTAQYVLLESADHIHQYYNGICACGKTEVLCHHQVGSTLEIDLSGYNTCADKLEYNICSLCNERFIMAWQLFQMDCEYEEIEEPDIRYYGDCSIASADVNCTKCDLVFKLTSFMIENDNYVYEYLKFNNNGFNIPEFEFIYHLTNMELEHEHEYIDGKCECGEYEEGYIPNYNEKELSNLEAEITFWHAMGYYNVFDEIIRLFNEFYPNITVHQIRQGSYDDLRDKIIAGIRSGTQPTIAQTYPHDVSKYLQANAIVSLDKYMNNPLYGITEKQLQDYIPTFLQECQSYDEKETLYSLPFNKSTEVLMFNASWFQKHGLLEKYNLGTIEEVNGEIVFVRNEGAMLTWEDIEEIGQYYINTPEYKSLHSIDKQSHYALAYDDDPNLFITLTQQFGGEFVRLNSDNKYEFAFNNKESKDAVEWFYNGFKSGYLTTSSGLGSEYSSDHFIGQNVIMTIGSSAGVSYNDPGDRFVVGVLPYPQKKSACAGETQKYVIQQGTNVSLFKCDDFNEELAGWLFMKFLTTWHPELPYEKQPTVIFSQKTHYLPILTSIYNHEEYKSSYFNEYLYYNVNNVCLEQYDSYYVTPKFVGFQAGRDAVGNLIRAVLYGGYSIDEAFEDAIAELKD